MDFYEISFDKIKILKPKIKDTSINSYLRNIKKISKELFNSDKPSINYFKDFDSVKKYVSLMTSIASQKNMITAILVLIKSYEISEDIIKLYIIFHKELSNSQEESYLDNIKTAREEKNWISRKDIQDKIYFLKNILDKWKSKKIDRKYIDLYQQYLVINLYTLLPPLRNDYVVAKVIKDIDFEKDETCIDKDFNYINLTTKRLLLCKYKTDKHYGIKTIDLPEELLNIILEWEIIKHSFYKEKLTHNFLLLNTTNLSPMKYNTLTKYINKIFIPKKISSTLLRKIYLSEKYPVVTTYRDQAFDAMVMGHSLNTQKMVYSKRI